jgi:hypothetical protein
MCTGMSGRPVVAERLDEPRARATRCELDIMLAAMTSQSSSRAEIARLWGVCQSPE